MSSAITIASISKTATAVNDNSGSLDVQAVDALAVDTNITAISGSGATLTVFVDRLGVDGIWYQVAATAGLTATGSASLSIGRGATTAAVLTNTARIRWTITGTTPSVTFTVSAVGRI